MALVLSFILAIPFIIIVYCRLFQLGDSADLAIRDVTAYLAIWIVAGGWLLWWLPRVIVRPARQIARVVQRIAEGDLSTDIPSMYGGEMLELAQVTQRAVDHFEQRDRLMARKIVEQRELVRRLVEMLDEPVLVVGTRHKIDFANRAAALAFGEQPESFEGADLTHIPGGEAVIAMVREILGRGDRHADGIVSTDPLRQRQHLARCAVVRDDIGNPSRVVMFLKDAEGAWWKRLFKGGGAAEAS